MDMLSFVMARPGSKAYAKGPFTSKTPKIQHPVGPGMENVMDMPVPESGLARAQWWDANRYKSPSSSVARAAMCSPSGAPAIGANERMVLGAEREDMLGAMVLRDHNWVNWNEPASEQSEDVARIWRSQTAASDGLWDGDHEVFVSEDATTIWD